MPQGDSTGPAGQGPRTGRGLGYCSGYNTPGFMNPASGRGMGRGFGRGFGRARGFGKGFGFRRMIPAQYIEQYQEPAPMTKEQETKILEAEKAEIEAELNEIKKEIEALKKTKNK